MLVVTGILLAVIWIRPSPALLYGTDAGCYARIAAEFARRPLSEWVAPTLGGEPFFEHPPLAFLVESLAFRALGARVEVAVGVARVWASLLAALVGLIAGRLGGVRAGAFAALSLAPLSGFLFESQNPMLELPLAVAISGGVLGLVEWRRAELRGGVLFSLGVAVGWFIKGPPIAVLLPVGLWVGWRAGKPWRAAMVVGASVATTVAAVLLFEAARQRAGMEPFFPRYLARQILPSVLEGRHNPDRNWFFFARPVVAWYLPALLALVPAWWAWRRSTEPGLRLQVELGTLLAAGIVLGFSLPVQKYEWYLHPMMVGAALVVGAALESLVSRRWERSLALTGGVGLLLGVGLVGTLPTRLSAADTEMLAIQRQPPPRLDVGSSREVAYCGGLSEWKARHLVAFAWNLELVPCEARAPFRFNGGVLSRNALP